MFVVVFDTFKDTWRNTANYERVKFVPVENPGNLLGLCCDGSSEKPFAKMSYMEKVDARDGMKVCLPCP